MNNIICSYGMKVNFDDLEEYALANNKDLDTVMDNLNIVNYRHVDGSVYHLASGENANVESIYIAKLNKTPSLFKRAYKDIYEVLEELIARYKYVFPDDYDYLNNIVIYEGSLTNNQWL